MPAAPAPAARPGTQQAQGKRRAGSVPPPPPPGTRPRQQTDGTVYTSPPPASALFAEFAARQRQQASERPEYIDPVTGEVIDLASWAHGFGGRFLIAKALQTRRPDVLTGLVADGSKVHIDCPNGDEHTDPGRDSATYVVNAGQSSTNGFVAHCRHAHCTGLDRGFFVKRMLDQGWLAASDLTDERFLLEAAQPQGDHTGATGGDNPIDDLMAEFNARYMVVNDAGKALIYKPAYDPIMNRRYYDRMTFADLRQLHLNRSVVVGVDKEGPPVYKQVAEVWLRHADRRQYLGGVTFDPSGRRCDADTLNLWQDFAVTPKPGCWDRLKLHIYEVICNSDQAKYEYLMCWMARLVQRPAEQGEVAVVMPIFPTAPQNNSINQLLA
ncbi:MAG: hypothetical protein ACJ8AI_08775 [Rhodopila sp.]